MNAVITGATKGMGRTIAVKLAQAGFNLILCSRSQHEIDDFCQELIAANPQIIASGLKTDCSNPAEVKRFANFVQQQFETVHVLINNVGVFHPASILDEEEDVLATQMQVNFNTAYVLCRAFGRKMREHKAGHIINICSVAALNPVVAAGSYSVTKAALLSLTKVLREELMEHKVKVTAIHPGSTLTNSWEGTSIPPDRFIAAEDVAETVLACLRMSPGANPDEIVIRPLEGNL
ncbi:SDR family oxidoreductase [Pedobacter sp. SYSU D00535]|uniref:SDR family oxidoreductase n=1 Tax=Pedobacter sp. SYSU D00535 TaxID=2810308 RepID=UPI001A96BC8D|nr:SDR family oxidoreductase [Pedobacter sp. SYSU D00535]